ncbi:MAG: diacylglycerol kinase family protein [Anaerolineae bacterium]|nr:diacylglycerol kinase family protein [Anaerolineae bacterium]
MSERPSRPRSRWQALVRSFGHALAGVWHALCTQQNMRIHATATLAVIALGVCLGLGATQWAVLALTIGMVLAAEMFNTVAEAAMDAATTEYHPLIKIAKDVAAGAVLISAIVAVIVGLLILGPPLWQRILGWLSL